MRLARARVPQVDDDRGDAGGDDVRGVVLAGERAVALPEVTPGSADPLLDLLRAGADLGEVARAALAAADAPVYDRAALAVLAPLRRPGKIVAIGLNYRDHTAETGLAAPSEPLTFAKYPSSIAGPGEPIVVPAAITTSVDWEAELAVVVGRPCGPARPGTLADVAAYTVGNDVSARDLQFADTQWTRGKSLDTFCPLGPELVTPDEVGDPQALRIWTTVNGATMQDATTADMIFDVATLLRHLTATVTLEAGDVVLTGTPPGVGGFRTPPVYLADGDVVTVGVERVGELTNPVRHV
ncbi:2-keto-4-pentenoate hydratase/2-oxohepta-3-ene-1,7-dioic acid hydratase (catechol pathway) [Jatrophihabitans endophyticus]|uniref:2-keto-4-pentenoate hydratase/2-oxohepta-3-ene-1,7-dioic acid hydratase (Catechol pathway) n=1 Tax=Jatrophihabitans endophyticus TaxID=1206085 RepID=A0A1M5CJK1_9ACTN|nr:fumarylacetoacetate hydrolase family protein [Jatrophihabitans endophyticus]SHF54903.1 2-keto-4-pentenoate hydratase/2-oxohepta-3-ene-1,7-dioic acid hydratase (catechol pathway) [Jatrophihabitans endophyticus]